MTQGHWKFIKLKEGKWAWQLEGLDGNTSRVGPFPSLEACIMNAKGCGYEDSTLDRRKDQRPG
jgi:hypothetical protein